MSVAQFTVSHLSPTHTGVSLATGLHVGDLSSWAQLASRDALIKLAPALAMVLLITAVLHRVRCRGGGV